MTRKWILILAITAMAAPLHAQLGSRAAKEWIETLDRDERVADLKIDEVIRLLQLQPGMTIADIGAGTGLFSLPLARAVGPEGVVLAAEVDDELLAHISDRASEAGLDNVRTVRSEFADANLPSKVDLAFFNDVIHHIEKRETYIRNLAAYLNPEARIAVLDPVKGHPDAPHSDIPEMQYSVEDLKDWMAAIGYQVADKHKLWERKFFLVFERR